jgi:hypothetical protein
MNLETRRISGSPFSAEDRLEVTFNSDNQVMARVHYTIELVSGGAVTHGGGGAPEEYLNYKSAGRDANADGTIDYSAIEMAVVQADKGTSVIKVVCSAVTRDAEEEFIAVMKAWIEREEAAKGVGEEFTEEPPTLEPTILTTGEITLEWSDDNFV